MLDSLLDIERQVAILLIQGYDYNSILEMCGIDYNLYKRIKKSVYQKLNIKGGMNGLLGTVIKMGVLPIEI